MKTFTEFKEHVNLREPLGVIFRPYGDAATLLPNIFKHISFKVSCNLRKSNLIYWNILRQHYISSSDIVKFSKKKLRYIESVGKLMVRALMKNRAKDL